MLSLQVVVKATQGSRRRRRRKRQEASQQGREEARDAEAEEGRGGRAVVEAEAKDRLEGDGVVVGRERRQPVEDRQ